MSNRVRIYIFATLVSAACAATLLYMRAPAFDRSFVAATLCLGTIALLTQLLAFTLARTATGSISFIPFLASAAIAPHWLTTLSVLIVVTIVQAIRSLDAAKRVFNICQQCLAISVAILVYLH